MKNFKHYLEQAREEESDDYKIVDGVKGEVYNNGMIIVNAGNISDAVKNDPKYNNEKIDEKIQQYIQQAKDSGYGSIPSESYARHITVVMEWVKNNNAYYYAEEKHNFNIYIAMMDAKKENKNIVVADNLS